MTDVEAFNPEPYEPDRTLPRAVIFDIDGTLSLRGDRGPYEFARCVEDKLNRVVDEFLVMCHNDGQRVILLSGRQEEFRPETEAWLRTHAVAYHELHMRPAKDRRRDDIVKAELFDRHVRHRFDVRLVLDDRDRCVALWRRMGLACWQVAEGDF